MTGWAEWLVSVLGIYAALGILFAILFVSKGVSRVDPAAVESGLGFRLLLIPATALLWPLMARRWAKRGVVEQIDPHRKAAAQGARESTQ